MLTGSMPAGCQSTKTLALQYRAIICRRCIFLLKLNHSGVARTIPGGMPPRARREHFHRTLRGLFIKVVLAWPMMSLQQLSNQPDTTSRRRALPVVRALPVNRRRAEHFISGTPLELDERPVLVTGLFSYMTRLRRGAKLTWQTKCLSTRPMKRRRA